MGNDYLNFWIVFVTFLLALSNENWCHIDIWLHWAIKDDEKWCYDDIWLHWAIKNDEKWCYDDILLGLSIKCEQTVQGCDKQWIKS